MNTTPPALELPSSEHQHHIRQRASNEDVQVPFLLASLGFAVLGGFTLALALPVEAALGRMDLDWLAHAQVHGHLQVIGFTGLFVLGVAARLAPRFAGRPIAQGLLTVAFWLLVAGLLGRAIGQPLASHPAFAALMVLGATMEGLGAAVALFAFGKTLQPWSPAASPSAVLLATSMAWLTLQACLGAWWLFALGREHGQVLPQDHDTVLLQVQVFGFLLSALLGVGLRSFPAFFGARLPQGRYVWALIGVLQGGLMIWVIGLLLGTSEEDFGRLAAAGGQFVVGAAVFSMTIALGWWRRGNRLAPGSRHFVWSLRVALGWLTTTGLLLMLTAARALLQGASVSGLQLDAIRHVYLVGVVTLAITVMGQLILPEFASERLVRKPGTWRGWFFAATLSAAAALRGLVPLSGSASDSRYWLMALAGALGLGSMVVFAYLYFTARNSHRAYLARIARWRTGELPLA